MADSTEASQEAQELLEGAVDMHVHSAPDQIDRWGTDPQIASAALEADMRAVVVKSHVVPTMDRASVTNELLDEDVLIGGIALNGAVGGVNPEAVSVALNQGAKVVWLPTVWNAHHASIAREEAVESLMGFTVPGPDEEVPIVENGRLTQSVRQVIDIVAEEDAVLATGHSSPAAIELIVEEAVAAGTEVVVTHPFFHVVGLPINLQEELAEKGATMEYCAYCLQNTPNHSVERIVEVIERIGPQSCVLATDFGQSHNPPVEGFAQYLDSLLDAGLHRKTVADMIGKTPARILNL